MTALIYICKRESNVSIRILVGFRSWTLFDATHFREHREPNPTRSFRCFPTEPRDMNLTGIMLKRCRYCRKFRFTEYYRKLKYYRYGSPFIRACLTRSSNCATRRYWMIMSKLLAHVCLVRIIIDFSVCLMTFVFFHLKAIQLFKGDG